MPKTLKWNMLDRLVSEGATLLSLPRSLLAELAERLEEALGRANPDELRALDEQLIGLIDANAKIAPKQALAAARGAPDADEAALAAYRMGQIGFAHLLAAQSLLRRTDGDFIAALRDPKLLSYVRALYTRERTNVELADALEVTVETVSRRMKDLRELGASDFRVEGTSRVNYLTPAASHVVETEGLLLPTAKTPLPAPVQRWVEKERADQAPFMRKSQSFAREPETAHD